MFGSTALNRVIEQVKLPKSSGGRRVVIAVCICVILLGGGAAIYVATNHNVQDWRKNAIKVERGSVDVRIIATGTIRPLNEVKVSPKSTGLIKKLLVKQGDIVKEGQVLAQMDDSNLSGQIEAARGTYEMAKDTYLKAVNGNRPQEVAIALFQENRARDIVHQAEQNIIRLRAQLESMTQQSIRDDTMAVRQSYLEGQGAVSDQDKLNALTQSKVTRSSLDAARRELAQAQATLAQNKAELDAAHKQYELSKIGNRDEDIQEAKHAVDQAKGNLDTLLTDKDDMTIRAPFDGIVTQKYADSGAIVTPTTSAATTSATSSSIIALAGKLEMVAQVAETDIGRIELGQDCEIVSSAFPERVFHGQVSQIAPEAVVTQNVTTFEVHTNVEDDRKGRLLSGMNVSARFIAGKMENVLLIPAACIVSRHSKSGVLIPEPDGAPKFKPVKIGPTVGTQTVILRGLKDGDLVCIGLNKEQLEEFGYGGNGKLHGDHGGGRGGVGVSAPIPRNFGH